jgi:hypothetical protein
MKRFILLNLFAILTFNVSSQQDIYFKINHKLGSAPFSYNQNITSNQATNYSFNRLAYYISEIKLTYDGGQDTTLNHYLLVDAAQPTNEFLGSFNITNLESVSFGIGVDPSVNNNDPNLWPSNHPLAPKTPAMHWGWAAGYFFVTVDGKAGDDTNVWQIHALGNKNYKTQEIQTSGVDINSDLVIEIDADYTQSVNNIALSGSLNNHGEDAEAAVLLTNFNSSVFTAGTVGLVQRSLKQLKLYPNPSSGEITIDVENDLIGSEIRINQLDGKGVYSNIITNQGANQISIKESGTYLINVYKEGILVGSEKVIIK